MDANLLKIFARYFFGSRSTPLPPTMVANLERQLREERISGREINNALMDFGAACLTYDRLDHKNYPLTDCLWFQTGGQREVVRKKAPRRSEK